MTMPLGRGRCPTDGHGTVAPPGDRASGSLAAAPGAGAVPFHIAGTAQLFRADDREQDVGVFHPHTARLRHLGEPVAAPAGRGREWQPGLRGGDVSGGGGGHGRGAAPLLSGGRAGDGHGGMRRRRPRRSSRRPSPLLTRLAPSAGSSAPKLREPAGAAALSATEVAAADNGCRGNVRSSAVNQSPFLALSRRSPVIARHAATRGESC